jgi:TetR/AcrR family transcriptional regulator, regulator of cefoperazone and chloramphenicol sensitivity
MKIQRKAGMITRKNRLEVAGRVFAEKGYRDATVVEICRRANVNVAAVNYHFNDKEALYREAWRYSLAESLKAYPPDGGVGEEAPPKERLAGRVKALLRRIADENTMEILIAQRELISPTGLLEEVIREELQPLHEETARLVRELLGPYVPDVAVRFCEMSVINQCINPAVVARGPCACPGSKKGTPGIDDMDAYADHVVKFSLAGIARIRRQAKGKKGDGSRTKRGSLPEEGGL